MGRVPRWRFGRGVYHVINRGINNSWILRDEEERKKFLELLVEQKKSSNISIYHWVLMSNHFHLVVESLKIKELSNYMSKVSSLYSRYWHHRHGSGRGTIWQGRFKSIVVQKEGYLLRLARYVERNPLAAGVERVNKPGEYKWSSASAYTRRKGNDPLVVPERHPYWASFGENDDQRRRFYRDFISNIPADDVKIFSSPAFVIGDKDFVANSRMESGRLSARTRGRPKKI